MEQVRMGMMCSKPFTPCDTGPFGPTQLGAAVDVGGEIRPQKTEQGWIGTWVMMQRSDQPD